MSKLCLRRAMLSAALTALGLSTSSGLGSGPVEYGLEPLYSGFPGLDDDFGSAMAIDGNFIAIGARLDDIDGLDSGAVYVYNRLGRNFLYAPFSFDVGPGDTLGEYVAIDDGKLYASARFDEVDGQIWAGSVYVFDLTQNGRFIQRLNAPTLALGDSFGQNIAAGHNLVLVGAPQTRIGGVTVGVVHAYLASSLSFLTTLAPTDGTPNSFYGSAIDVSADYVAVGASRNNIGVGIGESGSVYLYDYMSGALLHKLIPDDPQFSADFGASLAIVGDRIIVGAPFTSNTGGSSGSVYIFDAISGDQIHKIIADDSSSFSWFGHEVLVDGDTLVIAAPFNQLGGGRTGSIYLYDLSTYELIDRIDNPAPLGAVDRFGFFVGAGEGEIMTSNYNQVENGLETGVAYFIDAICRADLNGDGVLDFFDVSELLNAQPDYNGDGVFDFFDVSAFLNDYGMGCP